ncbi:hypothetical protein [Roseisolibacter agri]|uniref:Uncharacterized protein n=1 Tax=Roseisolibacter agri TaxID=2014610 RepID=A0AA37QAW8_9BACT|nr:hypothetical protein [Roseisolibacter agri]GLC26942.1 hypothetical protein rosag_34550 [Roseisolibacter agri]
MSTIQNTRRETATSYTPSSARDALLTDALTSIISGRPFPPELNAAADVAGAPVDSTESGIRRILAGPDAR